MRAALSDDGKISIYAVYESVGFIYAPAPKSCTVAF
jgi:hypothetical protein